jgi:uncharacterized protein (DUF1684 family)
MTIEHLPAFRFVLGALLAVLPFVVQADDTPHPSVQNDPGAAVRQEVESWRQERLKGLKNENGWLTLVGLFWLDEGENRFGSDPGGKVVLPQGKAPAVAGTLVRHGDAVTVRVAPGAKVAHDGQPVTELALQSDAKGKPVVLEMGTLSFFVIQRGDRIGVRVRDKESQTLASFQGLEYFPVDSAWRVEARFEPYKPQKSFPVPNILGMVEDTPSPGAVVFERGGKTYRLDAFEESDKGDLFLVFGDQTNGHETYGAGRFLVTEVPKDGKVVVDFNKSYNPPCAFTAFATCPLPLPQNRLPLRVEAGEKTYAGGHH